MTDKETIISLSVSNFPNSRESLFAIRGLLRPTISRKPSGSGLLLLENYRSWSSRKKRLLYFVEQSQVVASLFFQLFLI
jgi:hypothetical protein